MKNSRLSIATLLMSASLFQLVSPVLAAGTAANTAIDNTANASYEDPTAPGTTINSTSNKVTVTVAEVAGITVTPGTVTGGAVTPGNTLQYNFTLTNVGNTPTQFHIPGVVTVTGPGTTTSAPVEYSVDGGTTWLPVPAAGLDTPVGSKIPVGGTVLARVAVTVTNGSGTSLDVRLGNTPNSDSTSQPLSTSGAFDDVYTVGGTPVNGQQESSAILKAAVGSTAKNIAIATVTTARTATSDNSTPANLADDTITYGLELNVAKTFAADSTITPAPLAGSPINVGGTTSSRILVSNAVPAGTTLTGTPAAPAGWTVVYTTSDPATVVAKDAVWVTTMPASGTTRIGFVSNTGTVVATDTTLTGFAFTVKTTGATGTTYTVDSMAQAFGTTSGGTAAIVYDESGDQTPNNFDPATPLSTTTSTLPAAPAAASSYFGVASATYGVDASNNNTGTDAAGTANGEINEFVYTYTAPTPKSLLNGPAGAPTAQGPDATGTLSNNFDFTNKSAAVPAGSAPLSTIDPDKVGFFNTVQNTGTTANNIALLPELVNATDLPAGTQVKIYTAAGQSAIYNVNATGGFDFVSATGTSNGVAIDATHPVVLENVAPNGTAGYQVEVNLPAGTKLSTDTGKGFPVVIDAFIGGTVTAPATGVVVTAPDAANKTIDRVYTGFVKLVKETRILQGAGPVVAPADANFSAANKTPGAKNIIEYRITYTNISEDQVGSGNAILKASNLVITEDGTNITNSWAKDADANGTIDTSNVVSSAVNAGTSATIDLYKGAAGAQVQTIDQTGTDAGSDITKYVDKVSTVLDPAMTGSFSFKRVLN